MCVYQDNTLVRFDNGGSRNSGLKCKIFVSFNQKLLFKYIIDGLHFASATRVVFQLTDDINFCSGALIEP